MTERDARLAQIIDDASDSSYGALAIAEARRAKLQISLACAVVSKESDWENVFGHDHVQWPQIVGGPVTAERYKFYRALRPYFGNQGVGLTQLTDDGLQDRADELGGCWKPTYQLRVGFEELVRLLAKYDRHRALASYNAGEAGWQHGLAYADETETLMDQWHERLTT